MNRKLVTGLADLYFAPTINNKNNLLRELVPNENIYILTGDYLGNKSIDCIKEYGFRIQTNHNVRDLYFKGLFGGIPTTSYIDFEEIKYALEEESAENEKA